MTESHKRYNNNVFRDHRKVFFCSIISQIFCKLKFNTVNVSEDTIRYKQCIPLNWQKLSKIVC